MPLDDESESTLELCAERLKRRSLQAPLSRFAYKSTTPQPQLRPGPSRPTPVPRKDPPVDLPDAQLVQLSRCVACRLQWTSKKSPKQKRTHIEQCAKKNALTKDTIRSLIEQQIAPASDAREGEATLMDSVVPGPSKKARRQQVVPTVRSLPETRESILDRAKDILGPTNAQPEPHPTQQFGQSALACRNAKLPDVNVPTDEPPLTQPFGASALHQRTIASHMERSSLHRQSMFAQDAVSSNVRVRTFLSPLSGHPHNPRQKRPASPSLDGDARLMRQRIQ